MALRGKSALITGSASRRGLGYGILKSLAAAGCNVGMHGLMPEEVLKSQADAVAAEFGVTTFSSTADLRKPAEIRCAISAHQQFWHDRVHMFILNNTNCWKR